MARDYELGQPQGLIYRSRPSPVEKLQNVWQDCIFFGKLPQLSRKLINFRRPDDIIGLTVLVEEMQPGIELSDHLAGTL